MVIFHDTKQAYPASIRFLYKENVNNIAAFDGSLYSTLLITGEYTQLLVGLGSKNPAASWPTVDTPEMRLRLAAAKAARTMRLYKIDKYTIDCDLLKSFSISSIQEVVLGIQLSLYNIPTYRKEEYPEDVVHVEISGLDNGEDLKSSQALGESICWARSLGNAPSNFMTPDAMAKSVADMGALCGVEVEILDPVQIEALGMNSFLAVGKSATQQPRLIVMRYKTKAELPITALVGKGITCDTGGYCLKSVASMKGIKGDMCGGAAVAGAICALAKNKIPANVVGIIPVCENRIAPDSMLPGDVVKTMSGRTVEILNTDAEGRLILCDAITYAITQENANQIVDIATLTGAAVNTLGFQTAAILSNDDKLCANFLKASHIAGERYWRLPTDGDYRNMLDSKIADIKNIGKDVCGTITAGIFVGLFAEGKPWIHLDIAGTAWIDAPERDDQCTGATGAGTASLYHLLTQ